ncbi:MAG: hypothetical protein Q9174_006896, partial [Haloplaca sp. 1 TL-2023]
MTKIIHSKPSVATSVLHDQDSQVTHHTVPGGHGHAFKVEANTSFRITDLHGRQIVDLMAWVLPYPSTHEHLSMSYTRYNLGGSAPPAIGDCLYTNKSEPIFRLVAD